MEAMSLPGAGAELKALLVSGLGHLRRQGADAVLAWCGEASPSHSAFKAAGFLPIPERIRPIELRFGAKAMIAEAQAAATGPWYLSYFDSDTA